eukprot:TRINITY_DN9867_c0_g1_i2.p1 TRINITY_DN9867_c0_g1~~TRINITY_DN9867_c0_g1_i2.p1  ORF type:complete len:278 (+),score=70.39 TRINITY_DN9867_c0_g1_i2:85-834(+)
MAASSRGVSCSWQRETRASRTVGGHGAHGLLRVIVAIVFVSFVANLPGAKSVAYGRQALRSTVALPAAVEAPALEEEAEDDGGSGEEESDSDGAFARGGNAVQEQAPRRPAAFFAAASAGSSAPALPPQPLAMAPSTVQRPLPSGAAEPPRPRAVASTIGAASGAGVRALVAAVQPLAPTSARGALLAFRRKMQLKNHRSRSHASSKIIIKESKYKFKAGGVLSAQLTGGVLFGLCFVAFLMKMGVVVQ